ncbi:MAG: efflux RND transporter permease subunit, partial [Desulfonatronovibrio sp.]
MAQPGLAGWIAHRLMDSPLVPLLVIASLMLGGYGLLVTPREDRPDIDVPTAMVVIPWPGGGVEQVDEQLARRAGTWIRQLSSVTEVRSSSTENAALLMVEFEPGTDEPAAYAELQEIFEANAALLPVAAGPARIETFGEQRLVMFVASLDSKTRSPRELEQMAAEVAARLESVPGVRNISLHGGEKRAMEVLPRPEDLAAHGIHLNQLAEAIAAVSRRMPVGVLEGEPVTAARAGTDIGNQAVLARIPVGKGAAGPVRLEDVADIRDGSELRNQAVLHWRRDQSVAYPTVSLAVTTLAGRNVSDVTQDFRRRMEVLQADLIPSDVQLTITYDAGRDATKRVYSVLRQLLTGTIVVVLIIGLGLGWRAGLIIAMMMPASLAIVPYFYHRFGFSLNPVSIAAMILAIGILSDDAVVMLENISRQFHKAGKKSRELTVSAVKEVGNPTILADLLVVATLLPTAFITGEMGQYVRAIPVGASVGVLFSLFIALTITPYYGYRLLRVSPAGSRDQDNDDQQDSTFTAI